jgi:hypothetical protein
MDTDPFPVPAPVSEAAALLAQFAHRVATRDEPAPRPAPPNDRAALEAVIAGALKAVQPGMRRNRTLTQARLCYVLMQHPRLTTGELAEAAGVSRMTVYNVFSDFRQRRLAADEQHGGRHYHFLTREGEDWLLEVTR